MVRTVILQRNVFLLPVWARSCCATGLGSFLRLYLVEAKIGLLLRRHHKSEPEESALLPGLTCLFSTQVLQYYREKTSHVDCSDVWKGLGTVPLKERFVITQLPSPV